MGPRARACWLFDRAWLVAALWAVQAPRAHAQPVSQLKTMAAAGDITTSGGAVTMTGTAGMASLLIQTTGTFSATWELQCAGDGTTFDLDDEIPVSLVAASPAPVDTVSTNVEGLYTASIAGCRAVRVITTTMASGTLTVTLTAISSGGGAAGGGGGVLGSVSVSAMPADATELPAAAALADAAANPTVPAVGAYLMGWNGATWDRVRASPDPCASGTKLFVAINQTASTQLFTGTASNRTYVCAINVVSATAQNVALVNGTGAVCATGTAGMMGGTTAATGWNFAANGGIAAGAGTGAIAKSTADAANVCLLQSSTGQVSGTIAYVVAIN
jgi:hypothetical protein